MKKMFSYMILHYFRYELPGWGKLYSWFVGSYEMNQNWKDASPRIIKDKRYGKIRILDIREWADRSFYFLGRWYDLEAQLLLEEILQPGDVVVDVGANYGHFSLTAASIVGDAGKVIAFEPNPVAFARLRTHIALNNTTTIQVQNSGLSDALGELDLHVPAINSGEASFAGIPYEEAEVVTCPIVVGDDVIGSEKTTLIKIDVEGFELRVLSGLEETISRNRPWIITEIVRTHLARDGRTPAELVKLLSSKGYTPLKIELSGSKTKKRIALREFDSVSHEGDVLWVPEGRKDQVAHIR